MMINYYFGTAMYSFKSFNMSSNDYCSKKGVFYILLFYMAGLQGKYSLDRFSKIHVN